MDTKFSIEEIKPQRNYSIKETCDVLGLSRKKLFNLRNKGVVKWYLRKVDDNVRIKGIEILKFYNS